MLDEAQFVKNHQSKAYGCARRLDVPFKLAITGTPMENNLMELWSLLSITAPGLFPSPKRFAEYYQRPIEREADGERLALLRRRIRPFMLRRTKEEVASDLPPKQEQVLELDLHPRHRRLYDTHLQRERQKVLGLLGDMDTNRFQIFQSLTMLRQLSLDAEPRRREARRDPVGQARRPDGDARRRRRRGPPRAGVQPVHPLPGAGPGAAGRRGHQVRLPRRPHAQPRRR